MDVITPSLPPPSRLPQVGASASTAGIAALRRYRRRCAAIDRGRLSAGISLP
jgi:hypothetical protein